MDSCRVKYLEGPAHRKPSLLSNAWDSSSGVGPRGQARALSCHNASPPVQVPGRNQGPGGDDPEPDHLGLRVGAGRTAWRAPAGHLPQACCPRGAAAPRPPRLSVPRAFLEFLPSLPEALLPPRVPFSISRIRTPLVFLLFPGFGVPGSVTPAAGCSFPRG